MTGHILEGSWDVRITDTSLRDGSHHKRHQFTKEEVHAIVTALDAAGVPVIEVTHGDGLGGSSFNYGFSKTPEQELIKLAAETAKDAKIAFLMLPGVGTKEDIKEAQDNGGSICRIATHCTEADVSIQHFGLARELGRKPRVVVAVYPTRGLDARTAAHAEELLTSARDAGAGVLLMSQDLGELFELSDRLVVLRVCRLVGEMRPGETTPLVVGRLMTGGEA